MGQPMRRMGKLWPVTTGLFVGLAWGLFAALVEGLPLLLQGSLLPHLGERLLALAYLAAIYGLLCALLGGILGAVAWIVLRLTRRQVSRAGLAAVYAGLFAAALVMILGLHRFGGSPLGWAVSALLSAVVGLGAGWLLHQAAGDQATSWHATDVSWRTFRTATLTVWTIAAVTVLAVAGFRAYLRDQPLFNPPTTEEIATAERPNIVLITAGGVRPDHLGISGYDPEISPNVDALAWRGTRFEQAIAPASWTEPSLASLLTSLYPSELGIDCRAAIGCQPHLDTERTTLAEILREAGYHTRAYLTSPWLVEELGFAQGFDRFESVRAEEPFDLGPLRSGTLGRLLGCGRDSAACRLLVRGHERLSDTPIPQGWGGDHVNARVSQFLDLHRDERFFLWVHYTEALPPYDLEPPFRPMPEGDLASKPRQLKQMGYWELGDPFTPREVLLPNDVEGLTALYDAEVHRVDRLVGGLNVLLEVHGLIDRTLVVFASDHGQEFMEHGSYTYGHSLYDEVVSVPLIFAGVGAGSPGQAVETPVSLLDLLPTLAEMAGASPPPESEGRSLVAALQGKSLEARPVFSESLYRLPVELKTMRHDGYKLIYNLADGNAALYDLGADPVEQRNLAADSPQIAEAMLDDLLGWIAHTSQVAQDLPRAAPPAEYREAVW